MPPIEWKPATPQEVSQLLVENFRGARLSVCPVGGATSLPDRHQTEAGVLLRTSGLQRIIDYPARDMTITVEAGMTVTALQRHLDSERQQLPIDIPQPDQTTIGGAIACNISGPGRYGFGTFRDYIIGISAVDGQGRLFSAGGRVVKNVAGYDLCKLLIGSRGTLGVLTQVTLKLVPQPQSRAWMLFGGDDLAAVEAALQRLNLSATRPIVLDVLNREAITRLKGAPSGEIPSSAYLLCVGYAGTTDETGWQAETVASELRVLSLTSPCRLDGEEARRFWQALTEFQGSTSAETTLRVSVLPSQLIPLIETFSGKGMAIQAHAGNGILIGHFEAGTNPNLAGLLQSATHSSPGTFTISQGSATDPLAGIDPNTPAAALMRQLKETFDPAGIFPSA